MHCLLSIQITEGDLNCELDTYKQSRQGLDEMYNEARRQLKEECQLRQVCVYIKKCTCCSDFALALGLKEVKPVFECICVFKDVENELVVQVSMKQEMEMAMKLLEKDIHEKQDTLIGLRHQLDEVKAINVEMYQKMQVNHILLSVGSSKFVVKVCCNQAIYNHQQSSDDSMRQKNDMIARLEEKTNQITATMKQLEQR